MAELLPYMTNFSATNSVLSSNKKPSNTMKYNGPLQRCMNVYKRVVNLDIEKG